MKGRWKYQKQPHYAHMSPEDVRIWEMFIEQFPDFYITADYDVRVGEGRPYQGTLDPKIKLDMVGLSKKRIDVVGYNEKEIDVIEIKPNAGMHAIGQVLSYALMWHKKYPTKDKPRKVIITDKIAPDDLASARSLGVEVRTVER